MASADPDPTLEEMLATRLRVASVTVKGAQRTKSSFLDYVVSPVAERASEPKRFEHIVEDVSEAVERLRMTGCFKGVDAHLDRDAIDEASTNVTFTVNEKSLYQIRTGTSIETSGDREASLDGSLVWRNIFGRAESLRATAGWWGGGGGHRRAFGDAPSNSLEVEFIKPFFPYRNASVYTRIGQSLKNHEDWSSYSVNVRNAEIGVDTPFGRFAYQAAWREMLDIGEKASILIRDDAGHSIKSSLMHRIALDYRDDPTLPTEGTSIEINSELAGIGRFGNVSFAKCEAAMQGHLPMGVSGISLGVALRAGVVSSRASEGKVSIIDRFHIGGANSLRGFRPRGVGPRDGSDALGGETFYSATAMVSLPTPEASILSQLFDARVHAFATAGDVGNVERIIDAAKAVQKDGKPAVKDALQRVSNSARIAIGVGIAGDTPIGRVEINLCNALRFAPDDRTRVGVQMGVSQSFM